MKLKQYSLAAIAAVALTYGVQAQNLQGQKNGAVKSKQKNDTLSKKYSDENFSDEFFKLKRELEALKDTAGAGNATAASKTVAGIGTNNMPVNTTNNTTITNNTKSNNTKPDTGKSALNDDIMGDIARLQKENEAKKQEITKEIGACTTLIELRKLYPKVEKTDSLLGNYEASGEYLNRKIELEGKKASETPKVDSVKILPQNLIQKESVKPIIGPVEDASISSVKPIVSVEKTPVPSEVKKVVSDAVSKQQILDKKLETAYADLKKAADDMDAQTPRLKLEDPLHRSMNDRIISKIKAGKPNITKDSLCAELEDYASQLKALMNSPAKITVPEVKTLKDMTAVNLTRDQLDKAIEACKTLQELGKLYPQVEEMDKELGNLETSGRYLNRKIDLKKQEQEMKTQKKDLETKSQLDATKKLITKKDTVSQELEKACDLLNKLKGQPPTLYATTSRVLDESKSPDEWVSKAEKKLGEINKSINAIKEKIKADSTAAQTQMNSKGVQIANPFNGSSASKNDTAEAYAEGQIASVKAEIKKMQSNVEPVTQADTAAVNKRFNEIQKYCQNRGLFANGDVRDKFSDAKDFRDIVFETIAPKIK